MNNKISNSEKNDHPIFQAEKDYQLVDSSSRPLFGLLNNWKIDTQALCDELRD